MTHPPPPLPQFEDAEELINKTRGFLGESGAAMMGPAVRGQQARTRTRTRYSPSAAGPHDTRTQPHAILAVC